MLNACPVKSPPLPPFLLISLSSLSPLCILLSLLSTFSSCLFFQPVFYISLCLVAFLSLIAPFTQQVPVQPDIDSLISPTIIGTNTIIIAPLSQQPTTLASPAATHRRLSNLTHQRLSFLIPVSLSLLEGPKVDSSTSQSLATASTLAPLLYRAPPVDHHSPPALHQVRDLSASVGVSFLSAEDRTTLPSIEDISRPSSTSTQSSIAHHQNNAYPSLPALSTLASVASASSLHQRCVHRGSLIALG